MATVPASSRSTTYTLASDSAGPFLVGFRIFDAALSVYVDDVLTTDFTLSATFTNGYTDDASITFGSAQSSGSIVRIDGNQPISRAADYLNPDPNLTGKMNIELGRVWAGMQQLSRGISRLPATSPVDNDYATREALVAAVAAGVTWATGQTVFADGLGYRGRLGATGIPDLPGLAPADTLPQPQHYASLGDGASDDRAAFAAKDAEGGLLHVPAATGYTFSSPLNMGQAPLLIDPSLTWDELTDGGKLTFWRGRATDSIPTGSNIWRFSDRVFIGYGASCFAGDNHAGPDGGTAWLSEAADGPYYLAANAGVLFMSGPGDAVLARNTPYGFVSAIRSSDLGGNGAIGFGGAIIADAAGVTCWGGIMEMQREAGAGSVYGWELAIKNKGNNAVCNPNSLVTGGPSGAYGAWIVAGSGDEFGGAPVNPSTAAITILSNDQEWNAGIVFARDGLATNKAIEFSSEPANGLAHAMSWYNAAGNVVFSLLSDATDADNWTLSRNNNGLQLNSHLGEALRINSSGDILRAGTKVVGARETGWSVDTGTAKRTANATYSGTAEAAYTQATIQALMNAVRDATQTIKALKDDLHETAGHGLIGA
jgi:hypothetical protein